VDFDPVERAENIHGFSAAGRNEDWFCHKFDLSGACGNARSGSIKNS
jgi:hypothetical protein